MLHNPRIVCADGFSMSVQAHESSYCIPRKSFVAHTHMEGGFPSSTPLDPELRKFAEDLYGCDDESECDFTETVYGYVPREVFEREFELHGGIVEGKLPE
jgi:hypothetical protein